MSNTSKGLGEKGSKKWMQFVANDEQSRRQLNRAISGRRELLWISPLKEEDYSEYKLNHEKILKYLDIQDTNLVKEIFNFWPNQQSQWDGIACTKDFKEFYLVEAKAHLKEIYTPRKFLSPNSSIQKIENDKLILNSMEETYKAISKGGNFEIWKKNYYQLANRLTFMYFLNKSPYFKDKKFYIILLNFTNDDTHIPTSKSEWEKHYIEIWEKMIGNAQVPDGVKTIYWDLKN